MFSIVSLIHSESLLEVWCNVLMSCSTETARDFKLTLVSIQILIVTVLRNLQILETSNSKSRLPTVCLIFR